jgi:hypothetical protein
MTYTLEEIIEQISAHITSRGGGYSGWYVGIAAAPKERMFTEHNVSENRDKWIYVNAGNEEHARDIENFFIKEIGTKGGAGGGDHNSKFVYAYKIAPHTDQ